MIKFDKLLKFGCVIITSITIFFFVLLSYQIIQPVPVFFTLLRILNVTLFIIFAFRSRSLTIWILVSIVAGAEFGHDLPEIAKNMQFMQNLCKNYEKLWKMLHFVFSEIAEFHFKNHDF